MQVITVIGEATKTPDYLKLSAVVNDKAASFVETFTKLQTSIPAVSASGKPTTLE